VRRSSKLYREFAHEAETGLPERAAIEHFPGSRRGSSMTRTGTSEARFPLFGNPSGARYFLELAIVAATYFGIAETALLLPAINATATPLWPPTGLALSLILLRNDRIWPAILIGSIFASAISSSPTAFLESASSAIATTVAALAGA
jgi:hypothetical protein